MDRCPYCGCTRIIEDSGQYICANCGSVLGVVYVSQSTYSSPLHDYGLMDFTPFVRGYRKDDLNEKLRFYKRLKEFDITTSRRSRLLKAYKFLGEIASALGLNRLLVEEAKHALRRIFESGVKTTVYQAVAAALIYAVISYNAPIGVRRVIEACKSLGHRVSFGDVALLLSRLGVRRSVRDRVKAYAHACLSRLLGDSWVKLASDVEEFLSGIERGTLLSRNPQTLAAAAVYYACRKNGLNVRVEDIARILGVSQFTVRDFLRKFLRVRGIA